MTKFAFHTSMSFLNLVGKFIRLRKIGNDDKVLLNIFCSKFSSKIIEKNFSAGVGNDRFIVKKSVRITTKMSCPASSILIVGGHSWERLGASVLPYWYLCEKLAYCFSSILLGSDNSFSNHWRKWGHSWTIFSSPICEAIRMPKVVFL